MLVCDELIFYFESVECSLKCSVLLIFVFFMNKLDCGLGVLKFNIDGCFWMWNLDQSFICCRSQE